MSNIKKLKSIVFSMVVVAGMFLPASGFAQETGGGLFCRGNVDESNGWFRSFFNYEEDLEGDITNDEFEVPLGSGLAFLIGAGLGYAAFKKKEDEQ